MVLKSLILSLGISQILAGVTTMIRKSSRIVVNVPHIICVGVVFGIHVQEWWVGFQYSPLIRAVIFLVGPGLKAKHQVFHYLSGLPALLGSLVFLLWFDPVL